MEFLKRKHVNFKAEEVTITTYKEKNMKQWEISVSTRLKAELLKLKRQGTTLLREMTKDRRGTGKVTRPYSLSVIQSLAKMNSETKSCAHCRKPRQK